MHKKQLDLVEFAQIWPLFRLFRVVLDNLLRKLGCVSAAGSSVWAAREVNPSKKCNHLSEHFAVNRNHLGEPLTSISNHLSRPFKPFQILITDPCSLHFASRYP